MISFGSIDSTTISCMKRSHLRILLNLRELFMAGIAVHKFSFVLFARISGRPGSEFLNHRMATEDWWIIDELFMSDSLHSIN